MKKTALLAIPLSAMMFAGAASADAGSMPESVSDRIFVTIILSYPAGIPFYLDCFSFDANNDFEATGTYPIDGSWQEVEVEVQQGTLTGWAINGTTSFWTGIQLGELIVGGGVVPLGGLGQYLVLGREVDTCPGFISSAGETAGGRLSRLGG